MTGTEVNAKYQWHDSCIGVGSRFQQVEYAYVEPQQCTQVDGRGLC